MGIPQFFVASDEGLEMGEVIFILMLVVAVLVVFVYILKLQAQLKHHKDQLDQQVNFNKRLNETVDHILKIEEADSIDSNRRKKL